ncbi:MAG: hypothetical protein WCK34_05330 [Bacteroidota bacterium]
MRKRLTLMLAILASFIYTPMMAARNLDFATIDLLTYRCFQEKKWDSVIIVGKQALRQNIDYYYLRARMGISYFERTQYIPAIIHLKKAWQFNSGDPVIGRYLYQAYYYSNRHDEARLLRSATAPEDRAAALETHGFLEEVHFEGGYSISSDKSPSNLGTMMEKDSIYGERDLYGNSYYANLGLKLKISNRVGLSFAYNHLNFTKTKYIQYIRNEDHLQSISDSSWGRNYNYTFPWVTHDTSFIYHVTQNEACISAPISLPWGIRITPAFHWIRVGYNMVNPGYRRDTVRDTAFYTAYDNTYHTFPFTRLNYSFDRKDKTIDNFVAALRISKDFRRFTFALSGSWSNLNGKTQKQAAIAVTYYPLGNFNLYGTSSATGFVQGTTSRLLLNQVLGVKITRWMWGEANFYYGDYTNANIFNGSVVYNNSDIIDYRGGATLVFVVGKHIQLSLIYQYFKKESQQVYYIKKQDPDTHTMKETQQTKNNPYNINTLIGGITWKL